MSSILNALKKLEDESDPGEQDASLSGSLDTKQVVRKGIWKKHAYGRILWACFGITAVIALICFAAFRNPANVADQRHPQPEDRTAETKPANPGGSNAAAENRVSAHAQHKAQSPKPAESVPVPAPPAPAVIQENMAKFQDTAAKQGKNREENDPFRIPDELRDSGSTVLEKSDVKPISETQKPALPVSAQPSPAQPVLETAKHNPSVSLQPSAPQPVSETAKPAPRTGSPVPLLPPPKHPVKTEPVPMLPPAKNPVKIQPPQPLPVPAVKTVQDAQSVAAGQPESVKMPAPSEGVKKASEPESVKTVSGTEPAKSPARSEPVKASAPPTPGDCASVSEKTAGQTGLSIQALVWSEDPAGRMAVINGNIVREKGMLSDVSVVRIGSDCIVFQKGNEQWMQKFRLN